VRKLRISQLVALGAMERYLQDVTEGWQIHGPHCISSNIDSLLLNLEDLNFKVTLSAASELRELRQKFEEYDTTARISLFDKGKLRDIMVKLRYTSRAEARTLDAYVLSEKRFDVGRLARSPDSFLALGTFGKLPEIARFDLKEAGKCIAFELPTAGAFHLLRAAEDTLRSYFKTFFKRGSVNKMSWGQLVDRLRSKPRKPKPDEVLLHHLDHIRKNFRNPTDHPEMMYDSDQVQDLLALVTDALNRMSKQLPEPDSALLDDLMMPHISKMLFGLQDDPVEPHQVLPPQPEIESDRDNAPDETCHYAGADPPDEI
jgi:hypothetical protein